MLIGNFNNSCPQVSNFLLGLGIVGNAEIISAIGISVFISESAILDRWIKFEGSEKVYMMTVDDDYRKSGLTLADGEKLSRLILENHAILRVSRQRVVEKPSLEA